MGQEHGRTIPLADLSNPTRVSNAGSHGIGDIGVQLYTVRRELQRDFEGTLLKIAAIGYREVEFVDLFGRPPGAVRGMLDRHGLVAPSSRVSYDALGDRLPQSLEAAKILGQSQHGSYFGVCRTMP